MNKKFEYVDDNPGSYFGMLVENWENLNEDKKNLRNWIEKKVGKQMSNMKPTKIGYKHGRPYYAIDFTDGTSDDYFIDFDKEEIEKCESLTEDSDSNNDYLSKLKKEESELQSKITSIQQQYHYKGYMKDYKYKMASNRLKEVKHLIFKLEAESKNEKVLSKADVTKAIKKISGLETLKTTTSGVRGYRPVTGGSFKVDDGGLNNFIVYFYNNTDKIPEIIDELKKQGFKISYVQKSSFNVENTRSLNSLKNEALTEDKFVSRDKMSKKDRKELDSQKRNTWGNTNPVTRVQPNKKAYDRKRDKKADLDESKKLNESSDGWDESKLYDLSEILDEIYNLQYEVQNTVRGAYTNAHTYEELGYYVHNLGSNLMDIGDEIMEMEEEDGEDED